MKRNRGRVRRLGAFAQGARARGRPCQRSEWSQSSAARDVGADARSAGGASAIDPATIEARSAALAEARSFLEGTAARPRVRRGARQARPT
jgi:hypothetical protein